MNLDEISKKLSLEGYKLIFDICNVAKYRLPGSEGEKKAQTYIKEKMKEFGADEVEEFKFHVRAKFFKWWPKLSLLFYLMSLITYHFSALITIILMILMVANIGLKLFSFTFLDVLFRKKDSSDSIAKLRLKEEKKPKRIVIVGGHIDSTYEFPLGRKYGKGMIKYYIFVGIVAILWILFNLVELIIDGISGALLINLNAQIRFEWYYIIILCLTPFVTLIAFNVVSTRPVQGANDNLSGIAVTMGVLKYFSKMRLDNVELWLISFGSEEGGMAGSKALSKALKVKIDNGTFPAESLWVINFDSIAEDTNLIIATAEPMYRVKTHDPEVFNLMFKTAKKVGVGAKLKKIDAGTDSAPFARSGIPSVGIIAAGEDGIPANWHSREDIPENCDPKGIENSIKLAIQFLLDLDKSLH